MSNTIFKSKRRRGQKSMATGKGKSVMERENAADFSAPTVFYRRINVEGLELFYRESGPRDAPTVLLLHGFPSSSYVPQSDSNACGISCRCPRLPWIWRKLG